MTGEITLRGKLLPVGGIKEKILAAKRAGIYDIVLSSENKKDVDDIKETFVSGMTFHYFSTMKEAIDYIILWFNAPDLYFRGVNYLTMKKTES